MADELTHLVEADVCRLHEFLKAHKYCLVFKFVETVNIRVNLLKC